MAEKKTSPSFEQIMKDLTARNFSPIYILMGEEAYFIDKISDFIEENVLNPEERDFNQSVVFGSDVTAAQVADLAKGYPMMAEYRVVVVKEFQNLKSTEALEKYMEHPVKSTILVLCHKNGNIDRRKKLPAKAEQGGGVVFESKKLYDRELPGFITTYLKRRQSTIEPKAAQMMADHIGSDLNRLTSELDKVLISLPENDRCIIHRDVFKAYQIMKYFDKTPKAGSIYSFLPLLFAYFENLMIAYYAPERNNENSVAQYLDLRSAWSAKDYMAGMRNYSGVKTMQIIAKIREIDARSKGIDNPNTDAGELMKELIFFILH